MNDYIDYFLIGMITVICLVLVGCGISILISAPLGFLAGLGIITAIFTGIPAIGWLADKVLTRLTTKRD